MYARISVASSSDAARKASLIAALTSVTVRSIIRPPGAASVQPPNSGSVITACRSTPAWGRNDRDGGRLAHCEPMTRIRRLLVDVPIEDLCRGHPDPESTSYLFATEIPKDRAQESLDPI